MKVFLSVLFLALLSTASIAADEAMIKDAAILKRLVNLADDCATCAAYNAIVIGCVENRNNPSDADTLTQLKAVQDFWLERQALLSEFVGMSSKATASKQILNQQEMTAEIKNCVNLSVLILRHGGTCIQLRNDIDDIVINELKRAGLIK
jgi:hypothetical protein